MTKAEIKERINYILESAWNSSNEVTYYLEQLPHDNSDYDSYVHECITNLEYHANHRNKECYELATDDLVEYYFTNQEHYDDFN